MSDYFDKVYDGSQPGDEVAEHLKENIKGKNVLVTGCTIGGIGFEAARILAKYNANQVVITCRTQEKLDEATTKIRDATQGSQTKLQGVLVDMASLASVRKAAEEINALPEVLDVLIHNAGIAGIALKKTEDGNETHFAVNHLAPFLLTKLLLPKMLTSNNPPLVLMASSKAYEFSGFPWDDPAYEHTPYDKQKAYGASKTAGVLFTSALARKSGGKVHALAASPGLVWTNLFQNSSKEDLIQFGFMTPEGEMKARPSSFMEPHQGAGRYIRAAFDPRLAKAHNGALIFYGKPIEAMEHARGQELEEKCWKVSEKLVGETFDP